MADDAIDFAAGLQAAQSFGSAVSYLSSASQPCLETVVRAGEIAKSGGRVDPDGAGDTLSVRSP